ncbi:hypothetical protein EDC94DRAFT_645739 [Helicostylum pulchrum]|nr:hypothetical protein EDC94DRAFT_645739 [Helicostylum pulchrum]
MIQHFVLHNQNFQTLSVEKSMTSISYILEKTSFPRGGHAVVKKRGFPVLSGRAGFLSFWVVTLLFYRYFGSCVFFSVVLFWCELYDRFFAQAKELGAWSTLTVELIVVFKDDLETVSFSSRYFQTITRRCDIVLVPREHYTELFSLKPF